LKSCNQTQHNLIKYPEYAQDPVAEIKQSLSLLKDESHWKTRFEFFVGSMVYDREVSSDFYAAIKTLEELSERIVLHVT